MMNMFTNVPIRIVVALLVTVIHVIAEMVTLTFLAYQMSRITTAFVAYFIL